MSDKDDNDFPDFLGKYNEYLNNGSINKDGDRTFLDKKEQPTDEMIINLFITDDDLKNALDISDYNIKNLGKPDNVKTIEGTEWVLSKLVWFQPEGRVITFDVVQLKPSLEDGKGDTLRNIIDITHTEVIDEDYHTLLQGAIGDEDYAEAVRLRDWVADYKELNKKLLVLMGDAINMEDFESYDKYLNDLIAYRKTL